MRQRFFYLFVLATLLVSCSGGKVKYRIGISQCSDDIWRDKQNAELRMGAYFHDNVELKFAAAYDSDERQVQQIDSLVNNGIDLLIVAPNQVQTISPAIDRAYDKGIPVIVFERKTSSRKYTAFISADNYEMGRTMGEYIASRLDGKGNVLEIKGLEGSSPAIERHKGFMDAIEKVPGIKVVGSLQGDWTEETAYETTKLWFNNNKDVHVDLVFGANDRTAMGAHKAMTEVTTPLAFRRVVGGEAVLYCGIDGLPGENGGIQLVRDSLLDASYIYPTNGDQIIELAVNILEGKPYDKETLMMSALVTRDNAKVLLMQSEELMRQADRLDLLHDKADNYLHELDTQRIVSWLAIGIIVLLVVVFVLFYLYLLRKISMQRERVTNTLWNMEATVDSSPSTANSQQTGTVSPANESGFLSHFREIVETRLSDSNLSIDDLAADMNLSRVQLYRRVKAVSGSSPVELLRTARLNRAYQLLLTTDKSVSEVAYAVGFTAPSYFTKCFKEEYGMVPGDVRK
ncbi:substrate-binding domain-containing protein [Prevotella sp. E13-27]|uniref:AraC family transcriptional regulator n=1 Tax=Prevotella sp. E13-27 TaxID=2938122 RepID=UPI00200A81E4|nr:substrate-binding domain-containing protein [Prevotella sp. E13-27]MCK8620906.1 substrate-binding domain-containing protein [Prevotella sp. E13-27]